MIWPILCKNNQSLSKRIRIGTRGSKLALWQANFVKSQLESQGFEVILEIITTQGDTMQDLSFDKLEGKGFFTSELEAALIEERIDLAVHSMKDLPTKSSDALLIAGVSIREDPADWIVIHKDKADEKHLFSLPLNARIGTSSNRRKAQIKHFREDVDIVDIRGNLPTRLGKVEEGLVDAAILAAAGIKRIQPELQSFKVVKMHPREFIPAPAQGVLAYQIRRHDSALSDIVRNHLHYQATANVTNVERKILNLLEGGCHLPLGAYCEQDKLGYYHVWTAFADKPGYPLRHYNLSYSTSDGLAEAIVEYYLNN
ncbi:MAG: hydroxymethylbilane synthase [Saprospiraceae bacterium]|nr:hydroxymethylbilane synthase [Saprospiraceae bacterium]